jgi:DNA transposition AAA+ family ATPase
MMNAGAVLDRSGPFITTREHKRFVEFAEAVRQHRYIGLCYGPAGVGKTNSARRYAHWERAERLFAIWGPREADEPAVFEELARSRAVFYTPNVSATFRSLHDAIDVLLRRAGGCIAQHVHRDRVDWSDINTDLVELLVVDEAERLSTMALEHLRDLFDRKGIGLVLIGMPGMEKRLARYPQLYSRVGFAHHYMPLVGEELTFVLTRHWRQFGLNLDEADFSDAQAIAAIARITGGNFRLIRRLFVQIDRIMRINGLSAITGEVVEAARSTLVIGAT